ncbi:serine/threonine-protein kinase [Microbacterium sp. KSW4-11]|uniref:non-specific serine/threonine protein kinase n=1 Tax=Microbacterium gawkjiense TaxID=3067309 RepID=A0ABU3GD70_9MICO|nr:serine/threonine-protein kinase [Microbacterium sp. KSW4-11]MDT3317743.1 serine/threonine-protein kinase [Microbacterium sp. KSW4-11]
MPETTDHADDLLGGRYRLGETLGRGGMADVHRGEDVVLGREVAIKVVRSGADGVAADSRAHGEVSVLAALNHPSLVTLYDAQLDVDPPYLVMELVEGPTLTTRIARSPLTPSAAATMAAELGEALHVAHGAGVVHRDVKPSNVLLAPSHLPDHEFRAKLADFGIAYLVDTARVTNPGEVIGTAAYLAPEQVQGVDPAPPADVYALGLVLIESLTGKRAFPDAAGVATALARLEAPPEIPAELDAEWRDLLRDMTRIDPAERPPALDVAMRARALAATTSDARTEALPAAGAVAAGSAGAAMAAGSVDHAPDAATEALPPAGAAATDAPPPSTPATAPTSVLAAASSASPAAEATRTIDAAPASAAPAEGQPAERRPRRRSRRRATVWITAAAAAALVAGTGGILALTAGGDEVAPPDPAPVTDPTPDVTPTAPLTEDEAPDEVDTVSDTDTTDEQRTTPTPEVTTEAPDEEATPDEDATEPAEETAPTDGATDDEGTVEGGGTAPVEPSPAPTDDAVTEPDPADSPAPAEPSPAPTG